MGFDKIRIPIDILVKMSYVTNFHLIYKIRSLIKLINMTNFDLISLNLHDIYDLETAHIIFSISE